MKHALELQKELVALALSFKVAGVTVGAADGRIYFDSLDALALHSLRTLFVQGYHATAQGRRVLTVKRGAAKVWRIESGELRFGVRLELTEEEHAELLAGAWYGRQRR